VHGPGFCPQLQKEEEKKRKRKRTRITLQRDLDLCLQKASEFFTLILGGGLGEAKG